ncbi:MAG: hypothetical protein U9P72_05620 [Campylobacterota bacterium]|nr:hypothetical protein [Campylobacterota bacterium]
MKTLNLLKPIVAASLASLILVGCSGGSDSSTSKDTDIPSVAYAVEGVIVDPYIVGAILCEDLNKDGVCNETEQLSSSSTNSGVFGFENNLTAGSHVIVKTQGAHEGKTYDLEISGLVGADGSIDVVSPMTTFETKGLTTIQIAEVLNNAASSAGFTGWSIAATDISANPLSSGLMDKKISELSDIDLVNIQASLSSYGILKIMSGSEALSALNSMELYTSGMNGELHEISKAMIQGINSTLNTTTLTLIKEGIDQGKNVMVGNGVPHGTINTGLPEPTANLIIKVAVSIIDRLAEIGYETCNSSGGDVTAALNEVARNEVDITAKSISLGTQLYAFTYHDAMKNSFSGAYSAVLDGMFAMESNLKIGYEAKENGYSTIRFDSSNNLIIQ